jgi:hypothetical protein
MKIFPSKTSVFQDGAIPDLPCLQLLEYGIDSLRTGELGHLNGGLDTVPCGELQHVVVLRLRGDQT